MTTQTTITGPEASSYARTLDAIAEENAPDATGRMADVMREATDTYGPDTMKRIALEGKLLKR